MPPTNQPGQTPPLVLSGQLVAAAAPGGLAYDVLVGGVPFRIKPGQQDPYIRQVLGGEKDQFDSSREAGENSFGQWWLRSQSTFDLGSGQKYLDSSENAQRGAYFASSAVNPHSMGEVTLNGTVTATAGAHSGALQVTRSSAQKLVTMYTNTNKIRIWDLPGLGAGTDVTIGAVGVPAAFTTDGVNVWVAIDDKIYKVDSANVVTLIHSTDIPFTATPVLGFAKQRLILCIGRKVWELDPNPAAPPVTAHTAHYTNPSTGWVYTAVAEGPNGIYLTGHSGPSSDVTSLTVTESGGTLVLGQPVVQLRLPPAELAYSLIFYVGSLFALGTSAGVRVGNFTPYGQPQLGRLLLAGSPGRSLSASSTLIWVGTNNAIWRVDLSAPTDQTGGYACAQFATGVGASGTDYLTGLTVLPSSPADLAFGTTSTGRILSQPSYVPSSGTLTTSWVRFDTTEPKRLHYVSIEGDFPVVSGVDYPVSFTVEADTGETKTFNVMGGDGNREFSIGTALPAAQAFRVTFTLRGNATTQPLLRSWQMKARPAPRRLAEVILPLMCFDHERAAEGEEYGYTGFATERLIAIEALAAASSQVTVEDKLLGTSYQAEIARFQFRQDTPPTRTDKHGGVLNLVLRLV